MHHDALQFDAASPKLPPPDGANLTRFDRWAYLGGGLAMLALGMRRGAIGKALFGGGGAWLLTQAWSGRNPMFKPLDIRINRRPQAAEARETVVVSEAVSIRAPRAEVYRAFHDLATLPRFMRNIEWIHEVDETHSRWCAKAPTGGTFEWDSEIIEDDPERVIAWRGTRDGKLLHFGSVRLDDAPGDRGTLLRVHLEYVPVGGSIGTALTRLIGREPQPQMREDLRRLKQMLEAGEIATTEGQSAGGSLARPGDGASAAGPTGQPAGAGAYTG